MHRMPRRVGHEHWYFDVWIWPLWHQVAVLLPWLMLLDCWFQELFELAEINGFGTKIFRKSTVLRQAHRACGWLETKEHAYVNAAVQRKRLSAESGTQDLEITNLDIPLILSSIPSCQTNTLGTTWRFVIFRNKKDTASAKDASPLGTFDQISLYDSNIS